MDFAFKIGPPVGFAFGIRCMLVLPLESVCVVALPQILEAVDEPQSQRLEQPDQPVCPKPTQSDTTLGKASLANVFKDTASTRIRLLPLPSKTHLPQ